jgi:putative restriction endonuclease
VPGESSTSASSRLRVRSALLTVRPDYVVEVRQSILDEEDGPMLLHGLKGMHGSQIYVPREASLQPDRDRLEERYAAFSRAVG